MSEGEHVTRGRIIYEPPVVEGHRCRPSQAGHPPSGTVWRCACGRTSVYRRDPLEPSRGRWSRERWLARRCREWRQRSQDRRDVQTTWDASQVRGSYVMDEVNAPASELPLSAAITSPEEEEGND